MKPLRMMPWCDDCQHPGSYHLVSRGCIMPVLKGTNIPRGPLDDNDECEPCPCMVGSMYIIEELPV